MLFCYCLFRTYQFNWDIGQKMRNQVKNFKTRHKFSYLCRKMLNSIVIFKKIIYILKLSCLLK